MTEAEDKIRALDDAEFLSRVTTAGRVVRSALYRKQAGLPCWCGDPVNGHTGWLVCARAGVARDTAQDVRTEDPS